MASLRSYELGIGDVPLQMVSGDGAEWTEK
jgi:hypothetical protein